MKFKLILNILLLLCCIEYSFCLIRIINSSDESLIGNEYETTFMPRYSPDDWESSTGFLVPENVEPNIEVKNKSFIVMMPYKTGIEPVDEINQIDKNASAGIFNFGFYAGNTGYLEIAIPLKSVKDPKIGSVEIPEENHQHPSISFTLNSLFLKELLDILNNGTWLEIYVDKTGRNYWIEYYFETPDRSIYFFISVPFGGIIPYFFHEIWFSIYAPFSLSTTILIIFYWKELIRETSMKEKSNRCFSMINSKSHIKKFLVVSIILFIIDIFISITRGDVYITGGVYVIVSFFTTYYFLSTGRKIVKFLDKTSSENPTDAEKRLRSSTYRIMASSIFTILWLLNFSWLFLSDWVYLAEGTVVFLFCSSGFLNCTSTCQITAFKAHKPKDNSGSGTTGVKSQTGSVVSENSSIELASATQNTQENLDEISKSEDSTQSESLTSIQSQSSSQKLNKIHIPKENKKIDQKQMTQDSSIV